MSRQRLSRPTDGLWLFLIPSGAVLALVMFYPLAYAIYLSFLNYDMGQGTSNFVGLGNYADLLGTARLWGSLFRTLLIVTSAVFLEFVIGLGLAYALYRLTRAAHTLTVLMFLPNIVTPVVAAIFLRWMFMGHWGFIDGMLLSLGIPSPDWLGSPVWARGVVILADVWQFTPFVALILYAGLNSVSQSQVEAAHLDGASSWTVLTRIMIPAIKPLIIFVLVIRFMDAFRYFDTIYVLTAGGPGTATETVTLFAYALAFRQLLVGKGSAVGVLTLIVVAIAVAAIMFATNRLVAGAKE